MEVTVVPDELGKVLYEVATECDVQDLATAAHGEDGHVPLEGGTKQCELGGVSFRVDPTRLVVSLRAVRIRIDVTASREHEAVENGQRLLEASVRRRDHDGAAACVLDRAYIGGRHEHGVHVPGAPRDRLVVRGDSD
jgi:hypothetical protein